MSYARAGRYNEVLFSDRGRPLPGVAVRIRAAGTTLDAALFTSPTRTVAAANPVFSDAFGNLSFYTEPGFYDLVIGDTLIAGVLVSPDPVDTDPALYGGGGGGTGGHVIRSQNLPLLARTHLNFVGDSVLASDDELVDETTVAVNHKADAVHTVDQPAAAHGLLDAARHTVSGLSPGHVLKAVTATEVAFSELAMGTTTELADVTGGVEGAGASGKFADAAHAHFHGDLSAVLPNAHHPKVHPDADHAGANRHDNAIGGNLVGTRVRTNFVEGDGVRITGVDISTGAGQVDLTVATPPLVIVLNTIGGSGSPTPAALQEGIGVAANSARRTTVDLSHGRNWRMTSVIQLDGPAGAKFAIQWSADGTTWRYLDDTLSNALNSVQSPTPGANAYASIDGAVGTKTVTSWIAMPAAARADVQLRVVTFDGDGVGSGSVGLVTLQVK